MLLQYNFASLDTHYLNEVKRNAIKMFGPIIMENKFVCMGPVLIFNCPETVNLKRQSCITLMQVLAYIHLPFICDCIFLTQYYIDLMNNPSTKKN